MFSHFTAQILAVVHAFSLPDISDGCLLQCWFLWGKIENNNKLHGALLYFTVDQIKLGCGCCFPSILNEAYGVDAFLGAL